MIGTVDTVNSNILKEKRPVYISLKLFLQNTINYPQSGNAFDSLGDYYAGSNEKKKAIDAHTRSLSLQETADTRRKLEELKAKK